MAARQVNTRLHPARVRDANRTRRDLISAAQELFTREAYDQVGVRAIADRAGVNQSLLNRYFGSKAGLFRTVVEQLLSGLEWLAGDRASFGARVSAHICHKDAQSIDPLLILFRSTSHPEAAEIVRDALNAQVIDTLTAWLGGSRAESRAAAIVGVLLGMSVTRVMLATDGTGGDAGRDFEALNAQLLQTLVDG